MNNCIITVSVLFMIFSLLFSCAQAQDAEEIHASLKGYLFINELVASSTETDDWIEFYNPTNGAIDLSGFYLSDDLSDPLKWAFPDGSIILQNNYLVVMANNENSGLQTNFRLGRDEAVVLTTPGGTIEIDSIDYIENDVPVDRSYGRYIDGGDIWITFTYPTQGSSNSP
jgi:hypothetical protein